jgi:two-component system sensor histidine kinase TorS
MIGNLENRINVLLVDDDLVALNLTQALLPRAEFQVHAFTNPESAFEYARHHRIDLVITDQNMTEMTGLELMAKLRGELKLEAPFVMIAAQSDSQLSTKAAAGGAFNLLRKPVLRKPLLDTVSAALSDKSVESILVPEEFDDTSHTNEVVPLIDEAHVQELLETIGEEQLVDLVAMFFNQVATDVPNLCMSLRVSDFKQAKDIAHRIRGASISIGLQQTRSIATLMESAATCTTEEVESLICSLRDAIAESRKWMEKRFSRTFA